MLPTALAASKKPPSVLKSVPNKGLTSVAILWVDHHVALIGDGNVLVDGWANDGGGTTHQLAPCRGGGCQGQGSPSLAAWHDCDTH